MQKAHPQYTRTLPEPETRNGLSLARNDAFATITRSTLPACSFASTSKTLTNPFDPKLLRSIRFRSEPGEFVTLDPLSVSVSGALVTTPALHSPSGLSTFRIKAFEQTHHNKLASPDARYLLLPAAISSDLGSPCVIMPESCSFALHSVEPAGFFPGCTAEVSMNVLELCDPEAAAVPVEASVADAIRKMLDFHVGAVAIIDSQRRVAGIFTERDVLRKFSLSGRDPAQTLVRELMTTPVELATSQMGPGEALVTMVERHFRHLPVVDNNSKLLGMLSIRNVLEWRIEDLSRELGSLEQYVSNDSPGGD
jgi:CBS domain-containing protein